MIKDIYHSALYPDELKAMLKIIIDGKKNTPSKTPLNELAKELDDKSFCYSALNKVSRSFSAVIQQLPEDLKDAVCVFYLVLRALDTVEDDMSYPMDKKIPLLRSFHQKIGDTSFSLKAVGDHPDYSTLLENYPKVAFTFQTLSYEFQAVIQDICEKMGNGMADFAEKKVDTIHDYDLYCHYVAGLVGIGLSGLFSVSGVESVRLKEEKGISNSMGLFLQKTNIIRDYHEDLNASRSFWPDEVWTKYGIQLSDFKLNPASLKSLACLNELVTDALRHAPDCLRYMSLLKNKSVFHFCAIPQIMAIATLAKVYNNPSVYTGVVKIRKGLAAKVMTENIDMEYVYGCFDRFSKEILRKLPSYDPNYQMTKYYLENIFLVIEQEKGMGKWTVE